MRLTRLIGVVLALYGVLHLFGFLTSWDLIDIDALSRTPTLLPDELHIGVIRDLGLLWLAGLMLFAVAGYGAYVGRSWWKGVAFAGTFASLICSMLWIHEAWPGIIANLVILGLLASDWYYSDPSRPSGIASGAEARSQQNL